MIYRELIASQCLFCGNTLDLRGTRPKVLYSLNSHCLMFNGFLSPLSTCSHPSVARMNRDPNFTQNTAVVVIFHAGNRGLNWSIKSPLFPSSSQGQQRSLKHILPLWVMICHVGHFFKCWTVIWQSPVAFTHLKVPCAVFSIVRLPLFLSAIYSDQVNISWALLPTVTSTLVN